MKTKIMDIFYQLLGKRPTQRSPQIRDVFKGSGFIKAPDNSYTRYPKPLPPDAMIEAYLIRFLVSDESRDILIQSLSRFGYKALADLHTQVLMSSADDTGRKLMLFLHPSFAGTVVSIASNDLDVLASLQMMKLYPPLPADSFPWIDPESLGALQGDMDYWWTSLWQPFWESLSEAEQLALDIDPEWREFIVNHEPI